MRTRFLVFSTGLLAALAFATPGGAHNAGPCAQTDAPGHSEFAHHHVVFLAHQGALGAGGHTPGSHRGMSACDPSENRP